MSINKKARWRCVACSAVILGEELLLAPNPFDPVERVTGCPRCKACFGDEVSALCDEPDCMRVGGCGWPTGDRTDKWGGYRTTCLEHCAR